MFLFCQCAVMLMFPPMFAQTEVCHQDYIHIWVRLSNNIRWSDQIFVLCSNSQSVLEVFWVITSRQQSEPVLKRIIILGRIEYRILFVWWKLNESNIEYYSLIKKIFEYYSNTLKYSNIRIYSNKFAQNCKFSGSVNVYKTWNYTLIKKNFAHIDSHQ